MSKKLAFYRCFLYSFYQKKIHMKLFTLLFFSATLLFSAVDINNAKKAELTTLKGVGAKKSDAIISYRKTHCFKSVEGLTAVKGIALKTVQKK